MNNFATLIEVQRFEKVVYYTVSINEERSLFEQFVEKQTIQNKDKLHHIMAWVRVIGEKIGAYNQYFRNEAQTADTSALPPKGKNRNPTYVEINDETGARHNVLNNLRLYCFRANEHVVFLFNGDLKTATRAQDCPNVKQHFRLANTLTELLDEAFKNGTIQWNEDYTDIIVDDGFQLEWH